MSWNTLLSYIQALPNNVELSHDKKDVLIRADGGAQPITLSVDELTVTLRKSEPSDGGAQPTL